MKDQSLQEVKVVKDKLENRKAALEAAKAKGGEAWTSKLQEELDDVVLALVDVDEIYAEKVETTTLHKEQETAEKVAYVPAKGTEKHVHVKLIRGRRYNAMTGKEVSRPYVQVFSFGEWQLFKKNHRSLGFIIVEALHDPYGDAAQLVVNLDK